MLIQTTWDAWRSLGWQLWGVLDVTFSGISSMFESVFSAIPKSAMAFVIALACYALIDFIKFIANLQESSMKQLIMRVVSFVTAIIVFLFAVWRLGLIELLDGAITFHAVSEIAISLIYIGFAFAIAYAFMASNGGTLRTALQGLLWGLLFLTSFVLAPVFDGFIPTFDTVSQVLVCVLIFGSPKLLSQYKKERKVDDKDGKKKK